MIESNNAPVDGPSLRIGLIADGADVRRLGVTIRQAQGLELVGQAAMPKSQAEADVEWFDDVRVLLARQALDAVVLATSPRAAIEFGHVAAEHKVHVWRHPPLARSFAEATEVVVRMRSAGIVYRVASSWEHVRRTVSRVIEAQDGFEPVYSEVHVAAAGPAASSWRGSRSDAGGGVLMTDAYAALEAALAIRGLPESVHAAIGRARRTTHEIPPETEDFAAGICRYEDGGVMHLHATWDITSGPTFTAHHGYDRTVRYDDDAVTVLAADGTLLETTPLPAAGDAADLARFAGDIRAGASGESDSDSLERHVAMSALLETTYLSARTGQLERPRKLYEVQKWPEPN